MTTRVLVIGGGFAGCCAAHFLSEKGWRVTLVETAPFLGGGCKTFTYGGHPYTYGPRHFLTRDEKLFDFLNRYVPMRRIDDHQANLTYVESDAAFYAYPFHKDDVERMPERDQILRELDGVQSSVEESGNFEEYMARSIGPTLYNKFVNTYSKKMWQIESNAELDGEEWGWRSWQPKKFALKTGTASAWTGAISAFPLKQNGYDDYFEIATRKSEVRLKTRIEEFDMERHRVRIGEVWHTYDIIVSTISPEILLNGACGTLRWIGRDFLKIVLPVPEVFPPGIYFLYYANQEPFTRIVEYKKFYRYESPSTLLGLEIPSFKNKLYPYPCKRDQEIAMRYMDAMPKNVYSIGRMGSYKYIDVDDIIQQCMDLDAQLA